MKPIPALLATLAAACVVSAALTGCSTSPHRSTQNGTRANSAPSTGDRQPPAATPRTPQPTFTPVDVSAWPTTVVPQDEAPPGVKKTVIASGYTGMSYLRTVAAKWHIAMSKKTSSEVTSKTTHYFSQGTVHPSRNTALTLNAVWDLHGDMVMLQCGASVKAPQAASFLRDCTGADFPGARPESTAAWLDDMESQVDKAHKRLNKNVDSPIHRSGPAATYLVEGSTEEYGGAFYHVVTFGAGT